MKKYLSKKVFVSASADKTLTDHLIGAGYEPELVYAKGKLQEPVSMHPDMYMCAFKDDIFFGEEALLSEKYPGDVLYNAAAVGGYFICSRFTSPKLLKYAKEKGLLEVEVPQGYVKCNLAVIDDMHVITEDAGIEKVLKSRTDLKVLRIEPKCVKLPGYPYGFIGGASGRVGNEMIFNGNLSLHPDFLKITAFIKDCGVEVKYFEEYGLTDIGSIIAV